MPEKVRTVRVGDLWDVALEVAEQRGETLSADVIRPALERYVKRHSITPPPD